MLKFKITVLLVLALCTASIAAWAGENVDHLTVTSDIQRVQNASSIIDQNNLKYNRQAKQKMVKALHFYQRANVKSVQPLKVLSIGLVGRGAGVKYHF